MLLQQCLPFHDSPNTNALHQILYDCESSSTCAQASASPVAEWLQKSCVFWCHVMEINHHHPIC